MRFVQRCPCVARIATARGDARRYRREASRLAARGGSHDDITPEVLHAKADAALALAAELAVRRAACLLCADTGFYTGNGSADGGVQARSGQPTGLRIA